MHYNGTSQETYFSDPKGLGVLALNVSYRTLRPLGSRSLSRYQIFGYGEWHFCWQNTGVQIYADITFAQLTTPEKFKTNKIKVAIESIVQIIFKDVKKVFEANCGNNFLLLLMQETLYILRLVHRSGLGLIFKPLASISARPSIMPSTQQAECLCYLSSYETSGIRASLTTFHFSHPTGFTVWSR